jgi:hypothetical protein
MSATLEHPAAPEAPVRPRNIDETGLRFDLILQLLLKALHSAGELLGTEMADRTGLSFAVIEPVIDAMKTQQLCEIVGGSTIGPPSYRYRITSLGRERAQAALASSLYHGPAPVPLDQYRTYMKAFGAATTGRISPAMVRKAFSHLVLSDHVLNQLGPAVNSNHSMFVYGPPGNGKTVIAQAIGKLLEGELWVPYALEVDGAIIHVFDPVNHEKLPDAGPPSAIQAPDPFDRRWIRCKRPTVTVGGELSMEELDLTYSAVAGFYRAPVQVIANGGVLVIDDFGRQKCSPRELLNRWIHPLESRVDYLTLQSGQKIDIPFMVLPVFATNIKPVELVDEAFLRRIQYKIFAENPTEAEFIEIFHGVCRERDLEFDPAIVRHLLDGVMRPRGIAPRGCHPRDLVNQTLSLAQYLDEPRRLTIPLLESACATYFVDEEQGISAN